MKKKWQENQEVACLQKFWPHLSFHFICSTLLYSNQATQNYRTNLQFSWSSGLDLYCPAPVTSRTLLPQHQTAENHNSSLSPSCWACYRMGGGGGPQSRYFGLSEYTSPPPEEEMMSVAWIHIGWKNKQTHRFRVQPQNTSPSKLWLADYLK